MTNGRRLSGGIMLAPRDVHTDRTSPSQGVAKSVQSARKIRGFPATTICLATAGGDGPDVKPSLVLAAAIARSRVLMRNGVFFCSRRLPDAVHLPIGPTRYRSTTAMVPGRCGLQEPPQSFNEQFTGRVVLSSMLVHSIQPPFSKGDFGSTNTETRLIAYEVAS